MPRGRPRKTPKNLPAHIDYARVPTGIYWHPSGAGRWYVFEQATPDDRIKARTVAGPTARLSDLHAIAEARSGVDRRSLRGMLEAFHASAEFKVLAKATRADYGYCRARVVDFRIRTGGAFGDLEAKRIPRPLIQRLIDAIAKGRKRNPAGELIPTPSTAAHVLRYLRVAFRWAGNRGLAAEVNPADEVYAPKERKQRRLPPHTALQAVLAYARQHGAGRGVQGSVAPYLADVAELAYLCRLRGIEVVVDLNDADVLEAGLQCRRRKGSLTTITRWDPQLRAAVDRLVARRAAIWERRRMPTPLRAQDRPIVVGTTGQPLTKSGFNSAWQRLMHAAIAAGAITKDQRFGLHDLKRRGVTDTAGTRGEKQQASGHRNESMMDVYDQEVAVVDSAASSLSKNRTPA